MVLRGKCRPLRKICLAEGAFGYVALGKMDMDMDMDDPSIGMLSMADGLGVDGTMESMDDAGRTIIEPMPAYNGYVTVTASHRVVHCDGDADAQRRAGKSENALRPYVHNFYWGVH